MDGTESIGSFDYARNLQIIRSMQEDDSFWDSILDAKLDFLNNGTDPHLSACVRPEVADSWIGSRNHGLAPDEPNLRRVHHAGGVQPCPRRQRQPHRRRPRAGEKRGVAQPAERLHPGTARRERDAPAADRRLPNTPFRHAELRAERTQLGHERALPVHAPQEAVRGGGPRTLLLRPAWPGGLRGAHHRPVRREHRGAHAHPARSRRLLLGGRQEGARPRHEPRVVFGHGPKRPVAHQRLQRAIGRNRVEVQPSGPGGPAVRKHFAHRHQHREGRHRHLRRRRHHHPGHARSRASAEDAARRPSGNGRLHHHGRRAHARRHRERGRLGHRRRRRAPVQREGFGDIRRRGPLRGLHRHPQGGKAHNAGGHEEQGRREGRRHLQGHPGQKRAHRKGEEAGRPIRPNEREHPDRRRKRHGQGTVRAGHSQPCAQGRPLHVHQLRRHSPAPHRKRDFSATRAAASPVPSGAASPAR